MEVIIAGNIIHWVSFYWHVGLMVAQGTHNSRPSQGSVSAVSLLNYRWDVETDKKIYIHVYLYIYIYIHIYIYYTHIIPD